jgi:hypothetical protein
MSLKKVNLQLEVSLIILIILGSSFLVVGQLTSEVCSEICVSQIIISKQESIYGYDDYTTNAVPTEPQWSNESVTRFIGAYKFEWEASTDDGFVDHYRLEMSKKANFVSIRRQWTTAKTSKTVVGIDYGKFYFRVIAVDNLNGESSASETKELFVNFSFSGLIITIILLIGIATITPVIILRRRKSKKETN